MTSTVERRSRSHSQLSSYLHCSWAYKLEKLDHVPQSPSVWLPGGSAFHKTTEDFDRRTWEADLTEWVENGTHEEAFEVHADEFLKNFEWECDQLRADHPDESTWRTAGRRTKDKPNGEDLAWWREAGQHFVRGYIAWRISSADTLAIAAVEGAPGIELEVTLPLGGVPMRGFVDRVFIDRASGQFLVVDLKSGSRTPASPMQLALYSLQLEPILGAPVTWGAYYMARKGQLEPPTDLAAFTKQNLGVVYDNLDRAINNSIFMPTIDSHCKACSVRSACIFQGGTPPTTD